MSSVLRSPIHPLLSARVSLVHGQAGRTEQQFPAPLIAHLLESPVTEVEDKKYRITRTKSTTITYPILCLSLCTSPVSVS